MAPMTGPWPLDAPHGEAPAPWFVGSPSDLFGYEPSGPFGYEPRGPFAAPAPLDSLRGPASALDGPGSWPASGQDGPASGLAWDGPASEPWFVGLDDPHSSALSSRDPFLQHEPPIRRSQDARVHGDRSRSNNPRDAAWQTEPHGRQHGPWSHSPGRLPCPASSHGQALAADARHGTARRQQGASAPPAPPPHGVQRAPHDVPPGVQNARRGASALTEKDLKDLKTAGPHAPLPHGVQHDARRQHGAPSSKRRAGGKRPMGDGPAAGYRRHASAGPPAPPRGQTKNKKANM
ncbi:hypothetical protein T484DRAFT_1766743 [Baffinella frigidus]|nr:hypothetical protein T484DRAFT_1766743 [Cryptophyta sp. CCMP2293]